jgi:hypothetical protein
MYLIMEAGRGVVSYIHVSGHGAGGVMIYSMVGDTSNRLVHSENPQPL